MGAQQGKEKLLKAGELAKLTGVLVSTIRYYTKIGLLQSDATTPGNYNLYVEEKALKRLGCIEQLKKKRLTLEEMLVKLNGRKA
jgi:DNA-binding transcriptional MerR regulator